MQGLIADFDQLSMSIKFYRRYDKEGRLFIQCWITSGKMEETISFLLTSYVFLFQGKMWFINLLIHFMPLASFNTP